MNSLDFVPARVRERIWEGVIPEMHVDTVYLECARIVARERTYARLDALLRRIWAKMQEGK